MMALNTNKNKRLRYPLYPLSILHENSEGTNICLPFHLVSSPLDIVGSAPNLVVSPIFLYFLLLMMLTCSIIKNNHNEYTHCRK